MLFNLKNFPMAHGRFIFSNYLEEALMPKTLGTPITPPVLLFS